MSIIIPIHGYAILGTPKMCHNPAAKLPMAAKVMKKGNMITLKKFHRMTVIFFRF